MAATQRLASQTATVSPSDKVNPANVEWLDAAINTAGEGWVEYFVEKSISARNLTVAEANAVVVRTVTRENGAIVVPRATRVKHLQFQVGIVLKHAKALDSHIVKVMKGVSTVFSKSDHFATGENGRIDEWNALVEEADAFALLDFIEACTPPAKSALEQFQAAEAAWRKAQAKAVLAGVLSVK